MEEGEGATRCREQRRRRVDSESREHPRRRRAPFSPFAYTVWQPVMELQISDDITCLLATCDFAPGSPTHTHTHTEAQRHTYVCAHIQDPVFRPCRVIVLVAPPSCKCIRLTSRFYRSLPFLTSSPLCSPLPRLFCVRSAMGVISQCKFFDVNPVDASSSPCIFLRHFLLRRDRFHF